MSESEFNCHVHILEISNRVRMLFIKAFDEACKLDSEILLAEIKLYM